MYIFASAFTVFTVYAILDAAVNRQMWGIGYGLCFAVPAALICFLMWWGILHPRCWQITIGDHNIEISGRPGTGKTVLRVNDVDHIEICDAKGKSAERDGRIAKVFVVLGDGRKISVPTVFRPIYNEIVGFLKGIGIPATAWSDARRPGIAI